MDPIYSQLEDGVLKFQRRDEEQVKSGVAAEGNGEAGRPRERKERRSAQLSTSLMSEVKSIQTTALQSNDTFPNPLVVFER